MFSVNTTTSLIGRKFYLGWKNHVYLPFLLTYLALELLVWLLRYPYFFTYVNNPPVFKNQSLNKCLKSSVYTTFWSCFLTDARRKNSFCAGCFIKWVHTELSLYKLQREFRFMNSDCLGISPVGGRGWSPRCLCCGCCHFNAQGFEAYNRKADIAFENHTKNQPQFLSFFL